jgi:hypothetical protein
MTAPRVLTVSLFLVALAAGTFSDAPRTQPPLTLAGYRVLAGDFHVHSYPFNGSTIAPWDFVLEAERQGLDVIAITPQNFVAGGEAAQWFARMVGGPTVLTGEEIHAKGYHIVALGIHSTVSWHDTALQSIDEIHRQGGIAIAAHPIADMWPAYNTQVLAKLDATEVQQPVIFAYAAAEGELDDFYRRGHFTAIGSSDYHGTGPLGICRTYVFARDNSPASILEALREHRTVVYSRTGRAWGDPQLIRIAAADGRLPRRAPASPDNGFLPLISRVCGVLALIGAILQACSVYSPMEKEHKLE